MSILCAMHQYVNEVHQQWLSHLADEDMAMVSDVGVVIPKFEQRW